MTLSHERKNPAHGKWERLSRFFKTRKKTVTIVSALTVLTSFIVKEALDESAKDLLASIAAAERDNNQEQAGLYNQLTNINEILEIVKDKVVDDKSVEDT